MMVASEAERVKAQERSRRMVDDMGDANVRPYLVDALIEMWRLRASNEALSLEVERRRRCEAAARRSALVASALAGVRLSGYTLVAVAGVVVGALAF